MLVMHFQRYSEVHYIKVPEVIRKGFRKNEGQAINKQLRTSVEDPRQELRGKTS